MHQGVAAGARISKGNAQNMCSQNPLTLTISLFLLLKERQKQEEEKYNYIHNDNSNTRVTLQVYIQRLLVAFSFLDIPLCNLGFVFVLFFPNPFNTFWPSPTIKIPNLRQQILKIIVLGHS